MVNEDIEKVRQEVRDNLRNVRERIESSLKRAGRKSSDITLVAVSKGIPANTAMIASEEGCITFGESRIQEAHEKIPHMPSGLDWHMIGRLQSNKAREAVRMFSLIHSVDRISLAETLNRLGEEAGKPVNALVQVGITGASGQGGVLPGEIGALFEKISNLHYLRICGLMAIGPYPAGESDIRKAYRAVRGMFEGLAGNLGPGFRTLSLGMSGDYEAAIEEGSTMVRIGTAIFGDRRYK